MNNISSSDIMQIVREIQSSHLPEEQRKGFYSKRYKKFAENHGVLFEMACRPNMDMEKLEYMLNMRDRITKGKMSVENASKKVGQKMFDEYVKPIVGEQPPATIEGDYPTVEEINEPL